jgi:thiol-disulfide isomerase/thioredoxin
LRNNRVFFIYVLLLLTWILPTVLLKGQTVEKPVKLIKSGFVEGLNHTKSDTLYLLNFWSTSCKPCIQEMPVFDDLCDDFRSFPIRVIFISLDPVKYKDTKLADFLKNNPVQSDVWLLDEKDPNKFIPHIDKSWTGAIPATLFLYPSLNIKLFHEGIFTKEALYPLINSILK